jgi:translation initiation factor 1
MGLFDGTEWERDILCDRCAKPEAVCICPPLEEPPEPFVPPENQRIGIRVEKRKKGKQVTVIDGLEGPTAQMKELLTQLKTACGSGGTVKDGTLEIQGKHAEQLGRLLREMGYRTQG